MPGVPQLLECGQWLDIEPADPAIDVPDIALMVQAFVEMGHTGALHTLTPDRATCDRLARLVAPYVTNASAEALGDWYASAPDDFIRTLRYVLIRVLYGERPSFVTDEQFRAELWRALVTVLKAFIKRYGFRPPRFDD